ncbi:MAG: hypothetical protein H0X30_25620 [Anaerolineae bacterium]|nr:hypothetical protein [Anaerolineae bacterium]
MPVLLLAQGDAQAKDLLRKAIHARYGLRPPALDSLHINFKGRARAKLGPVNMWVPVEAIGRFCFPDKMRWDFAVKAVGVQLNSGTESFDGTTYHTTRKSKSAGSDEKQQAESMQHRLWAIAAVMLTPLGEMFVKLKYNTANELEACNTRFNGAVNLHLRADQTLNYVETSCQNPDSGRQEMFTLRLSDELVSFGDLILPSKISAFWNNESYFEIEPMDAAANVTIEDDVFALVGD